jgi:hypothetical protein
LAVRNKLCERSFLAGDSKLEVSLRPEIAAALELFSSAGHQLSEDIFDPVEDPLFERLVLDLADFCELL